MRSNKRKLNALDGVKLKPQSRAYLVWDSLQRGLALQVQPTGYRAYKCIYNFRNRTRWYHIGAADAIGLADARRMAAELMLRVLKGEDPAADKKAARGSGTFAALHERYLEYAMKRNRSWKQADKLIKRNAMPRWGTLSADTITRADVKAMMRDLEDAPTTANQTPAACSAVFTWAIREDILTANPDDEWLERAVSRGELLRITGLSYPTIWKMMCEGTFPRPLKISKNRVAWLRSEVLAYLKNLERQTYKK
jgi:predicted DNA-binding transcriptional regulator AlpA